MQLPARNDADSEESLHFPCDNQRPSHCPCALGPLSVGSPENHLRQNTERTVKEPKALLQAIGSFHMTMNDRAAIIRARFDLARFYNHLRMPL